MTGRTRIKAVGKATRGLLQKYAVQLTAFYLLFFANRRLGWKRFGAVAVFAAAFLALFGGGLVLFLRERSH